MTTEEAAFSTPVVWTADATPLIVLAKIGHLDLMSTLADVVLVPRTVVDEVLEGNEDDSARQSLEAGWGQRIPDAPIPPVLGVLRLDPGEEAVLAAALARPGSHAILDDLAARKAAKSLGVPAVGTLGIIARAKREGYIPAAKPLMTALRAVQFRAGDALIEAVLIELGELWL